jgi:hypothetical protein
MDGEISGMSILMAMENIWNKEVFYSKLFC